ncbi:MAG: ATP-dependent helicase, partial [Lachnospiraceae bacterium]|nr:ATP-dependent helicase [Lachnospiraceae bacterium]
VAAELIRYLDHEGIDYVIPGDKKGDDRFGIGEDMAAYLRAGSGIRNRRDILRIMNRPNRFLCREALTDEMVDEDRILGTDSLSEDEAARWRELFYELRLIGSLRPYAAVNYIRKGIGYETYLYDEEKRHKLSEGMLIRELDGICSLLRDKNSTEEALRVLGIYENQDKTHGEEAFGLPRLMTFHSSKGLEFERVIMIGCNDGITPSGRAQTEEAMEEERRLFYVALTRAKEEAFIFTTRSSGNKPAYPSKFIRELG